jgi:hypothetical protein
MFHLLVYASLVIYGAGKDVPQIRWVQVHSFEISESWVYSTLLGQILAVYTGMVACHEVYSTLIPSTNLVR